MTHPHWIDAHCHLADPRLKADLSEIFERAHRAGVDRFVQGGIDPADWDRQESLASARPPGQILSAFGLHPMWVAENSQDACESALADLVRRLARPKRAVETSSGRLPPSAPAALGELGLDHRPRFGVETRPRQLEFFQRQLELPEGRPLPLILHVVRAHAEALQALKAASSRRPLQGIVHSFSGSFEVARQYLDLGFFISVGGTMVGLQSFEKTAKTVIKLPPDRLVLETDSPDQPPPSYAGRLNEPASLWEVACAVGSLRNEAPEAVLDRSRSNLEKLFPWKL